jgi:hypothetical protein
MAEKRIFEKGKHKVEMERDDKSGNWYIWEYGVDKRKYQDLLSDKEAKELTKHLKNRGYAKLDSLY